MNKVFRILVTALIASAVVFPTIHHAAAAVDQPDAAARITRLADAYVKAYIERYPENAAFAGMTLLHNDRFFDNSVSAARAWEQREDGWLSELSRIPQSALVGKPGWITYGFLREALESSRGLRVCRQELWTVNQVSGWQATLPDYLGVLPLGTPERRQDPLKQWKTLPQFLETDMTNLKAGLAAGYSTPRRNVELVIAQLDGYLKVPIEESPLYVPAQRDPAFRASWTKLMADTINPAIRKYRAFLATTYLPKARTEIGVSANPDGTACYAASLRAQTGLTISPPKLAASQADRIVVTPGQLTTYWAGALEIMALREQSQKALGDKFDLRAFHDEVLKDGSITLPMLREKIDRWLQASQPAKH